MPQLKLKFEHYKTTKNKERYKEIPVGEAPMVIQDLYIERWVLKPDSAPSGWTPPGVIEVTLSFGDS